MQKDDIFVIYGTDCREMAKRILAAARIEERIGPADRKIGLKPNLVVAKPAEEGATTHPALLAGAIEYLQEKGYRDITILEGSWVGEFTPRAFELCGYRSLAEQYHVKLVDTQKDRFREYECGGMKIKICDSAMAVDFMINMPVLKGHCQTSVTCALKNNKGILPNAEKRRFHTLGLHQPIAHLNTVAKNDFILVDGICGDLDFEEGGNPVPMNRVMGAADPVLCDACVCALMGYSVSEVPYISMAAQLGVGCCDVSKANIRALNEPKQGMGKPRLTHKVKRLARKAKPDDACSACYGSLIRALERLDEAGKLDQVRVPICIGQGYRGKDGELGVGSCTCGFRTYLKGCPPKATDILEFLKKEAL